jgi:hypothetical protein
MRNRPETVGDVSEPILRQVNDGLAAVRAAVQKWSEEMAAALKGVDFEAIQREAHKASTKLAEAGWTLPMSFSPRSLKELVEEAQPERIDEFFEHFYTRDQFRELRRLRAELRSRSAMARWFPLLEECFDSFEAGRHLVTIPSLLSVIEGTFAKAGNSWKESKIRIREICDSKAQERADTVSGMMWNSLGIFAERIFPMQRSAGTVRNQLIATGFSMGGTRLIGQGRTRLGSFMPCRQLIRFWISHAGLLTGGPF